MNQYFERAVLDADPIDLVRLLHQHAIARVKDAKAHLAAGNIAARVKAITDAYAVMTELSGSLRADASPALVARLNGLYCFVQQSLLDANLQQREKPLNDALSVLVTLLEGWNGIAEAARSRAEDAARNNYAPAMQERAIPLGMRA